jgi:hypothetical protein
MRLEHSQRSEPREHTPTHARETSVLQNGKRGFTPASRVALPSACMYLFSESFSPKSRADRAIICSHTACRDMKKLNFLVSLHTRDNDFQSAQAQSAEETTSKLGIDADISFANNDAVNQSTHVGQARPSGGSTLLLHFQRGEECGWLSQCANAFNIPRANSIPGHRVAAGTALSEQHW